MYNFVTELKNYYNLTDLTKIALFTRVVHCTFKMHIEMQQDII